MYIFNLIQSILNQQYITMHVMEKPHNSMLPFHPLTFIFSMVARCYISICS
jgi:hypothetical protein